MDQSLERTGTEKSLAAHGWLGLLLAGLFWVLNWNLPGLRTHWGFFPMWLGYCLIIDALVLYRTGTSLFTRSAARYFGLFLVSAPVWWIFEILNDRLQNWHYEGAQTFSPLAFTLWSTISFTTVIPAVFGSAELLASTGFIRRLKAGPKLSPTRLVTGLVFSMGWAMLALMLVWPWIFFPFMWLSLYFILEPVNIWLGNHALTDWTQKSDWRPVVALWGGVLLTAYFWEMWNYFSYPKWVYHVPWGNWLHIYEMPLLGYGGYLPFALELYAVYHFVAGLFGHKRTEYVHVLAEPAQPE